MFNIFPIFSGLFLATSAFAQSASDELIHRASSGTVYRMKELKPRCPGIIHLQRFYSNESRPGDVQIMIEAYEETLEESIEPSPYGSRSNLVYRPGLQKGHWHELRNHCQFLMGISCREDLQLERGNKVTLQGKKKILSLVEVDLTEHSLSYDKETGTLTYAQSGHTTEDSECAYSADNTLLPLIDNFHERLTDDSARSLIPEKRRGKMLIPALGSSRQ